MPLGALFKTLSKKTKQVKKKGKTKPPQAGRGLGRQLAEQSPQRREARAGSPRSPRGSPRSPRGLPRSPRGSPRQAPRLAYGGKPKDREQAWADSLRPVKGGEDPEAFHWMSERDG